MNTTLLIDSIVRQTTVLLAQLATAEGSRTPVAHLANQVFLELADELERQGVSRKVSADMFGMALRAYQRKVMRLRETTHERGSSLWEAVLDFVRQKGAAPELDILDRFPAEDAVMRGVLHDLVKSKQLSRERLRRGIVYKLADGESQEITEKVELRARENLIRALIFSKGTATLDELIAECRIPEVALNESLAALLERGALKFAPTLEGGVAYQAPELEVLLGSTEGWEAAVFDHFQAVVRTVNARLREMSQPPQGDSRVGGSTYHFDLWAGHPLADEVHSSLARVRSEMRELRAKVEEHNAQQIIPSRYERVTTYIGQVSVEMSLDIDSTMSVKSSEKENSREDDLKDTP